MLLASCNCTVMVPGFSHKKNGCMENRLSPALNNVLARGFSQVL